MYRIRHEACTGGFSIIIHAKAIDVLFFKAVEFRNAGGKAIIEDCDGLRLSDNIACRVEGVDAVNLHGTFCERWSRTGDGSENLCI